MACSPLKLRPACLVLAALLALPTAGGEVLAADAPATPPAAAPMPDEVKALADTVRARLARALETSPKAGGTVVGLDVLVVPSAGGPAVMRPFGVLKGGPATVRPSRSEASRAEASRAEASRAEASRAEASRADASREAARAAALAALAGEFARRLGPVYGPGLSP